MPLAPTARVGSVKEFLQRTWLAPEYPDTNVVLFRGQLKNLPLLPKLFRSPNTPGMVRAVERSMLDTLKKVAPHLRPSEPKNDWDWLSLGQHYGLSTRMSDWSANPLVALFFAVELDGSADASPIVFCYPITTDIIETETTTSPLKILHTRVIRPGVHSHRSEAQAAWHIVHAIHRRADEYTFIPLDGMPPHDTRIIRIPIEKSKIKLMRAELALMGISHATVYGDYQSVCRSIGPAFGIS